ncbi:MAG: undecaprenyl-diphosphate phosphatase [Hyphomicrobiaceae bacterium]
METWQVIVLGLLEGLTEFIPVSSTGHLLLAGHFLGVNSPGKTFEVLIQLGAIVALLSIYFAKLWKVASSLHTQAESRKFVISILTAFLPAAFVGVLAHDFIKSVLFETPTLICATLIIGGVVLLMVDRMTFTPRYRDAMNFPISIALLIGVCQCLAMIPGVSRSGATIVGALMLGTDKRSAAEFSFFLAMPTMAGAFAYDLYKNYTILDTGDVMNIVLGFVMAFIAAVVVVKFLLDYVSRYGFSLFAWWRIVVGTAGLVGLAVLG